mgnify:CR=1 FL=1
MKILQEGIGFEGNTLYVYGKQVNFDFPIYQCIIADGVIWVLEDVLNEAYKTDNAYGVSMDAEVLMRIQPPTREIYKGKSYDRRMPYTGIGLSREGYYSLRDFAGMEFIFDPNTGEIIGRLPSSRF